MRLQINRIGAMIAVLTWTVFGLIAVYLFVESHHKSTEAAVAEARSVYVVLIAATLIKMLQYLWAFASADAIGVYTMRLLPLRNDGSSNRKSRGEVPPSE